MSQLYPLGYLNIILHAHLPFVRHPEDLGSFEERWLFEAVAETYLPLLELIEGWERDGVDYRLTLSLSPTLLQMLADPLLKERCLKYLENLITLAESELTRTILSPPLHTLAQKYHALFIARREQYAERYQCDLISAFVRLAQSKRLNMITTSATHAFLPLFQHQPKSIQVQLQLGLEAFTHFTGLTTKGFWSPECGCYHGFDQMLAAQGIHYFFLDSHGLLRAQRSSGLLNEYMPIRCASSQLKGYAQRTAQRVNVSAFGRDPVSAESVWNAKTGYPSDPDYREFYRDLGYDAEFDYIVPYIHSSGRRLSTGFKYHKITGPVSLGEKTIYDWDRAIERASQHASAFIAARKASAHASHHLCHARDKKQVVLPPIMTTPYDAELFGHWWFEGPVFLDCVVRQIDQLCKEGNPQDELAMITPEEYLALAVDLPCAEPSYSSWGAGGHAEVWLDSCNDWIYPRLHSDAEHMMKMASQWRGIEDPLARRILNQMVRELLLAQSSDWAFIMRMRTMVDYAERRTREHLENFDALRRRFMGGMIDPHQLEILEARHNIFPDLQFEIYTPN